MLTDVNSKSNIEKCQGGIHCALSKHLKLEGCLLTQPKNKNKLYITHTPNFNGKKQHWQKHSNGLHTHFLSI